MSFRWTFAVVASLGCLSSAPAWSEDAVAPATAADREVEASVAGRPESIDAWESRRPALVRWLQGRLDQLSPEAVAWSVAGEAIQRDHCSCFPLRYGVVERGRLFVPAEHLGRGPAVVFFAAGPVPATLADQDGQRHDWNREACEDIARAGYVTLLIYEAGTVGQAFLPAESGPSAGQTGISAPGWRETTQADARGVEFLLDRREVDPDRIAVIGVEASARRAWWVAALDQRLAAVASLSTPEMNTLEDRLLTCLIAPRPHRLALDTKGVRERQAAYRRWLAAPQSIHDLYELPALLSTRAGAGFGPTTTAPAWRDTLRWLNDGL